MPKIVEQKIIDALPGNYMPYAMSVIVSRALPEIDGFKPSHRKLLYTMYKMNLLNGGRTKSANVVGQTMKLNPHGDMAIYETMVRQTRGNGALLHPLVDSKGNFGKIYSRDMAFAAARYTEVKLDSICNEIFADIEKDTVDFADNYDGTIKEPKLLPTRFPNLLTNPNLGIAVGMASNICSFNLAELCAAAAEYLRNPEVDLLEHLLAPDFSTGGYLIYNRTELETIYKTGRGSFKLRAKYRYNKKQNCIEIYEIPYTTTCEAIIDKLAELVKQSKLREVSDIRDETDLNGLKITVDLKRGVDAEKLMSRLYKQTSLEDSFACNFNVLVGGKPRVMGVGEILTEWTLFRIDCIKRGLRYDIAKKKQRLHLLKGLEKILLDIDKAIRIIRNTVEDRLVISNLMAGFSIEENQAEFIAEIRLRNLNKEYILNKTAEIAALENDIDKMTNTLGSDSAVKRIVVKQLQEISKKYGAPRKTEIMHVSDAPVYDETHFIDDYGVKLFLTRQNYFKKISLASLRAAQEHKMKDDDEMQSVVETTNKSDVLLFSDQQNVYKLKTYDIADCKAAAIGEYLPNLLGLPQDERIIQIAATSDYDGFMLFVFENGKAAKIALSAFETKTNRKKLANAYDGDSPLVSAMFLREDADIAMFSDINKCLVFNTAAISQKTTRNSKGVNVLKSKKGSKTVAAMPAEQAGISDLQYYKTKSLPAMGYYLK